MPDALVIAGCLSGEVGDAGAAALVRELAGAVGAGVTVRARTGGRPVGAPLPTVLSDLRRDGARSVLVVTTHVAGGYLQRAAASAVRAAASGFEELRLAPPLLADEGDAASVAAALDAALPARPGRLVALAGHRGVECEAALALLESALWARGREDALVGAPDRLAARLRGRPGHDVLLAPLLMALGHHARRDVLGDLAARLSAQTWPNALAELPVVRALVVDHATSTARAGGARTGGSFGPGPL